ncbi:MAG: ABC transporter permease subunit, partial [Dehalococcoidia bacterium]|nr:ABC transporter permease subunit [Dehalococcoidia bacterium]
VVTVIGLSLGGMISGSVFLEQIFSLPGLGRYIVNSVNQSDYPAVQAFVLLAGVLFTLVNLIIDLTYTVFDPRIRYS